MRPNPFMAIFGTLNPYSSSMTTFLWTANETSLAERRRYEGLLSSAIEDPPSPHPTDEKGTGDEPEMSENRRSSTLLLETVRPAMETKNR